ncbi:MAG: UDP-glucose/GDP-mannose dehydrogenase family protein [Bacteroidota bacterium]
MKITVIGTGYVGLVSGTCFAETGNQVTCVDIDELKVERMQNGEVPIYEPGLEALFNRNIKEGRLTFTTNLNEAVQEAEIIFLCLPTPPGANGQADLTAVLYVAEQLGSMLTDYTVIVNKSTVPVGTADRVSACISKNATVDFDVVSNPEFLREGAAIDDFMKPERVVVGTRSHQAAQIMKDLYAPFVRSGNPIIIMDERSSELTKYAANALLATKITFMNEIANICEKVGGNVDDIRRGIGTDSRIGKRFLFAGIGYGGSCFPKDVQAIHYTANQNGYDFKILDSVMRVNEEQKVSMVPKILSRLGEDLSGKTFGVWGLAFKPETDDVREAPALYLMNELAKRGATFKAFDPEAMDSFAAAATDRVNENTSYVENAVAAITDVDALIIATEWAEFRNFDPFKFDLYMNEPIIFDGRNLYDLDKMARHAVEYTSVGRSTVAPVMIEEPYV